MKSTNYGKCILNVSKYLNKEVMQRYAKQIALEDMIDEYLHCNSGQSTLRNGRFFFETEVGKSDQIIPAWYLIMGSVGRPRYVWESMEYYS